MKTENYLSKAQQTGTITVNGNPIAYRVQSNIILYADGKIAAPSIPSTDFVKAYATAITPAVTTPPVTPPVTDPDFTTVGSGSGPLTLGELENVNIRIAPGNYDYITIKNAVNVKIDATDVILNGGSVDIDGGNDLELWGLAIYDQSYRAININGYLNKLHLHDMNFRNVANNAINYSYKGRYDGFDGSVSADWTLENCTFENTGTCLSANGEISEDGNVYGLFRNFKFLNNVVVNCPDIGSVVWMSAVEDYEIAGNRIDHINTFFGDPNAPNGYHNAIFQMIGNGSLHDNKCTNHQGNLIRAWGLSFGTEIKDIEIYNNIVWNSWKYSAFELQVPPYIQEFRNSFPDVVQYTNAQVYNNTAGHLSVSQDWNGEMIDLYFTGGTLEYYNNLGFEMYRPEGEIRDMINMGGPDIILNENNVYVPSQQQAVSDTVDFVSLIPGVGAQ